MLLDKTDVVVLTKNSAITLEACLHGIFDAIPVSQLIVVDGGSSDATLRIARKYHAVIIHEKGYLARARYRGALEAETQWFCFVDSDIVLHHSWYQGLKKWTKYPKVAWIRGLTGEQSRILPSYALSKILRHRKYGSIALSNSLLRRDIVLKCSDWLREDLHVGEDNVLHNFFESLGYRVITDTTFVGCLHIPDCFLHDIYALFRWGVSNRIGNGGTSTRIRNLGIPALLLRNAFIGLKDTLDLRLLAYYSSMLGGSYLLGYLGIGGNKVDNLMKKIDRLGKDMGINKFRKRARVVPISN